MRSKVQKEINEVSKKLGNLTDKQLEQYVSEAHKKQNKERASKGGIKTLRGRGYTSIQKKGNKTAFEMGVGIHNKENPNYKKWKAEAGIKGAKRQMSDGIGIHTDKETRREWSRLGGLKSAELLNKEKICPHCKIVSRGAGYNRWHGDNCKMKKSKK
jgi:hypothetical protein